MQLLVCCKSDYRNVVRVVKNNQPTKKVNSKMFLFISPHPSCKGLFHHSNWQRSPITSCSSTLMWQRYILCGLSKLPGVWQEFFKPALLPENYIVKWCLRWIPLMFTCRRSADGAFHSWKKNRYREKKNKLFDLLVHQSVDSLPSWCEQFQHNHHMSRALGYFPPQNYFSILISLCPFQLTEHFLDHWNETDSHSWVHM